MTAVSADRVVVELIGDTGNLDANVSRSAQQFDQSMTTMARSATRAETSVRTSMVRIGDSTAMAAQRSRLLGLQIADIGTQLASGTNPFIIIAQQAPQVANALEGSRGVVGRLATFLSGPFGAAVLAGASVLGIMIGKLMEASSEAKIAETRLKQAADGADAFGDAQSILGKLVDLTTGKLKNHNEVLKATIRLQALLALEESQRERRTAYRTLQRESARTEGGFGAITPGGTGIGQATPTQFVSPEARSVVELFAAGATGADTAIQQLQRLNREGKLATKTYQELRSQVVEFGQATQKGEAAQAILDYLDTGQLDPRLRQTRVERERKRREKEDRTAEILAAFEDELRAARQQQLQDELAITTNVERRREIEDDLLLLQYQDQAARIAQNKDYSDEQKRQLRELLDKRFGVQPVGEDIVLTRPGFLGQALNNRYDARAIDDALAQQRAQAEASRSLTESELEMARTQKERRRLQLKILEGETALQRAVLEAVIAKADSTDVEKQIAQAKLDQLDQEKARRAGAIRRDTMGPLEQYLDQIPKGADELNESLQAVAADGLDALNDGLTDAIMNADSLGEVFSRIADQIIADLLRIAIQQAVIKPLAQSLFGASGGGGFFADASAFLSRLGGGGGGSAAGGLGSAAAGAVPGFATGGSMVLGGAGGIDQNLLSLNGRAIARVSRGELLSIVPPNARAPNGGGMTVLAPRHFDLRGAVLTPDLVRQINAENRQYADAVASQMGRAVLQQVPSAVNRSHRYGT